MIFALPVVPLLFAAIVLIGWWTDDETFKRVGLATVTMNPTTALGFVSLGLALMFREADGRVGRWITAVLVTLAGAIGALKLLGIAIDSHIEVDTFLFASKLAVGDIRPSRIAPNAAICFVLISSALLLMDRRSERAAIAAQVLALATSLISIFALVGYLYGVGAFYIVPAFFPMAIHTAIGFLCWSAFVFMRTSQRGLIVPISDPGPAGRSSRLLLPAAIVIPVAFGWLRQKGEHAGWYTAEIGVALMVMVSMLTLTVLIWWNAELLCTADKKRRQAEVELARLATHDFLTGLPNRAQFMDRLMARMASQRRRSDVSFAIIYMDLDGFKQVNDRLGHGAGDTLLRDVAEHLRQYSRRDNDLVARLGGDEFAMLLDEINSADDATRIASRIVADMPARFGPDKQQIPVGISVGIVVADIRHKSAEALLNEADEALYHAKRNGKGRFSLYPAAVGGK